MPRSTKHGAGRFEIEVESFLPDSTSGKHGPVHVRAVAGQGYDGVPVQCSRELCDTSRYPVGSRFRVLATTTDQNGKLYLSSHFRWKFDVLWVAPE